MAAPPDFEVIFCEKIVVRMKNVKFRGKKTNTAENSAAQIPREKPKFRRNFGGRGKLSALHIHILTPIYIYIKCVYIMCIYNVYKLYIYVCVCLYVYICTRNSKILIQFLHMQAYSHMYKSSMLLCASLCRLLHSFVDFIGLSWIVARNS